MQQYGLRVAVKPVNCWTWRVRSITKSRASEMTMYTSAELGEISKGRNAVLWILQVFGAHVLHVRIDETFRQQEQMMQMFDAIGVGNRSAM
jgi:hypothetical protein